MKSFNSQTEQFLNTSNAGAISSAALLNASDSYRHKSDLHDHALYLLIDQAKLIKMLFHDDEE